MNLQDQVTSLEISQRLKELGVKQESLFYWYNSMATGGGWKVVDGKGFARPIEDYVDGNVISAFTVAELGEILPDKISPESQFEHYILKTMKNTSDGEGVVSYESIGIRWTSLVGDTEANARGKLLIYLLENKLITL